MLSPFINRRMGGRPVSEKRKQSPAFKSPRGMTPIVSPTERSRSSAPRTGSTAAASSFSGTPSPGIVSPQDPRMTPTRRMLFQKKRLSSTTKGASTPSSYFTPRQDDDSGSRRVTGHWTNGSSSSDHKKQSKKIQDRFNSIQRGLGSIDEERNTLIEKSKQLEQEKKQIGKQLKLREREILALVKRCATQEEKMREATKLRIENRELKDRLDQVSHQLSDIEQDEADLYGLKKKLQDSELDREHLQDKLTRLQREHDSIMDTLQECLGKIRVLTEEREQLEEERRLEKKAAEAQLAKERLEHEEAANNLQEDIQLQQTRIVQMEKILRDSMYSNTSLRRENALLLSEKQKEHESLEDTTRRYESQMSELQAQIERTTKGDETSHENHIQILRDEMAQKKASYDAKLMEMKGKIDEKDDVIGHLRAEMSTQMAQVIEKQLALDKAEEDKKCLEEKIGTVTKIETERDALVDYVKVVDSNMASLMEENVNLMLDKDALQAAASEHKTMLDERKTVLSTEEADLKSELTLSQTQVTCLKRDLDEKSKTLCRMENELTETRRAAEKQQQQQLRMVERKENCTQTTNEDGYSQTSLSFVSRGPNEHTEIYGLERESRGPRHDADEDLIRQLKDSYAHIVDLEEQLKQKDVATEALRADVDATKKTIVEYDQKFLEVAKERDTITLSLQVEHETQLADKKAHIATVESNLFYFEKSVQSLSENVRDKDDEIDGLKDNIKKTEEENRSFPTRMEEKTSCLNDTKVQLERTKHELAIVRTELENSKASLVDTEAIVHSTEAKLLDYADNVGSLQQELQKANHELMDLQCRLSHQKKQEVDFEANDIIIDLQKELESKERDNKAIMATNKELQEKISEMELALTQERFSKDLVESESTRHQEHASSVCHQLQKSQTENKELLCQLHRVENDLEVSRRSHLASTSTLEAQVKNLTTTTALKEDEIRELRLVELQDAEETIESLTDELGELGADLRNYEKQLQTQTSINYSLRQKLTEMEQNAQAVGKSEELAKGKIEELKTEMELARSLSERRMVEMANEIESMRLRVGLNAVKDDLNQKKENIGPLSIKKRNKFLERENNELKDKVKRQETFLQRKIEKERTLRERNSFRTPTKQGCVNKTLNGSTDASENRAGQHASAVTLSRPRSQLQGPSTVPRRSTATSSSNASVASPGSVTSKTSHTQRPSSSIPSFRTPKSKFRTPCRSSLKEPPTISHISFDENMSMTSADELSDIFGTPSPAEGKDKMQNDRMGEF
mmetsp:Transcript_43236/g.104709  ORF Transcript_43236/g.104709 Transcript_43236/m.104709 type:complete len:1265 (-) Transcript_43236:194-3988(-)